MPDQFRNISARFITNQTGAVGTKAFFYCVRLFTRFLILHNTHKAENRRKSLINSTCISLYLRRSVPES